MAEYYTTKQNQTWDVIAKEVYGDEKYTEQLMKSNLDKIDIFVFSAGTVLYTPVIATTQKEQDTTIPDWRN